MTTWQPPWVSPPPPAPIAAWAAPPTPPPPTVGMWAAPPPSHHQEEAPALPSAPPPSAAAAPAAATIGPAVVTFGPGVRAPCEGSFAPPPPPPPPSLSAMPMTAQDLLECLVARAKAALGAEGVPHARLEAVLCEEVARLVRAGSWNDDATGRAWAASADLRVLLALEAGFGPAELSTVCGGDTARDETLRRLRLCPAFAAAIDENRFRVAFRSAALPSQQQQQQQQPMAMPALQQQKHVPMLGSGSASPTALDLHSPASWKHLANQSVTFVLRRFREGTPRPREDYELYAGPAAHVPVFLHMQTLDEIRARCSGKLPERVSGIVTATTEMTARSENRYDLAPGTAMGILTLSSLRF